MKMKKEFAIISVVLAVLLLASCSSVPKVTVYDPSIPTEQSSTLRIVECAITEFNGKKVGKDWEAHGVHLSPTEKQIIVPAGAYTLRLYGTTGSGQWILTSSATMTGEFLPGHTYYVTIFPTWNHYATDPLPAILDEAELNRQCTLVPNPANPNTTPFEGIWVNTKNEGIKLIFAGNQFLYTENVAKTAFSFGNTLRLGKIAIKGQTISIGWQEIQRINGNWYLPPTFRKDVQWKELEFSGTTLTDISGSIVNPSIGIFRRAE
jgi:hypothetical protein